MTESAAVYKVEPKSRAIQYVGSVEQEDMRHNVWLVEVPPGTEIDDLTRTDYWAHVAVNFSRGDEVKVLAVDDAFYAHLLVLSADRTWARMAVLYSKPLSAGVTEITGQMLEDYDVKLRGPKRWSVIRKSDNKVLMENLHQESDASRWLREYLLSPV